MLKRAYGAVALAGVSALALSACGGGTPSPSATTSAAGSATSKATTSAAAAPTTTGAPVRDAAVDLVIWCDQDRKPILDKYAAQFGTEQGIKVAVQVSTDVRKDFKDATNAGKGPDVIVGAHDWLGELVQNQAVSPINLAAADQAKFPAEAMAAAKFNGQIYGVPYAMESIGIVRNTDLAPDAPKTFEEMVTKGQALVKDGKATNAVLLTVSKTGDAYHAYPFLNAFGGGVFAQKENGDYDASKVIVGSPESILGGEQLAKLGKDGILSTNVDGAIVDQVFDAGKAPYAMTGPWAIDKAKKAGIKYAISPLPTIAGKQMYPFLGVQMFYVSAKAKNAAFAQEFVTKYVMKKDLQIDMYNIGKRPPALTEAYTQVAATDADVKAWGEAAKGAAPMPNIPAMNSVWGPMGQATADIIAQKAPAATRLQQAQQEIVANIAKG
ncbi:MAG TPA: maltose ABC transporter substrate-binding protein [Dermatophilaceae bacterium]|nr:maltose ABC transporter substrate-binding protein [Dermatophilaceae bacterium]